jgi:hypothetical protein|tara:strand:+ start:66 stop:854 length:789 start_codon:yes stop_codon:yes gene_type:complete
MAASPDIEITVSAASVAVKLEKLAKKAGVSIGFLADDQMRLWLNDIMKQAAPSTLAKGRKAIRADIDRLFVPIDNATFLMDWKEDAVARGGDIFRTTKRGKKRVSAEKLKAQSIARLARIHRRNRRKKDGRVKLRNRDRQEAFNGKFLVPKSLFNKYLTSVYKRVGFLKSRFGSAALHYATRTRGGTPAYKNWIRKHIPGGSFSGKIVAGVGEIRATNDATFAAKQMLSKTWWRKTERKRQRDLTRGGFKRMKDLTRRFNAR